jgi:hypothetical protein
MMCSAVSSPTLRRISRRSRSSTCPLAQTEYALWKSVQCLEQSKRIRTQNYPSLLPWARRRAFRYFASGPSNAIPRAGRKNVLGSGVSVNVVTLPWLRVHPSRNIAALPLGEMVGAKPICIPAPPGSAPGTERGSRRIWDSSTTMPTVQPCLYRNSLHASRRPNPKISCLCQGAASNYGTVSEDDQVDLNREFLLDPHEAMLGVPPAGTVLLGEPVAVLSCRFPILSLRLINSVTVAPCTVQANYMLAPKTEILFCFNQLPTTPTRLLGITPSLTPFIFINRPQRKPEFAAFIPTDQPKDP